MLTATLLALGSAFIHAGWNLLIKTSDDRRVAAWGLFLCAGLLSVPLLAIVGLPGRDVLPWLILTALVHVVYLRALTAAFTHGDFSATYPVARGGGALLAAIGGAVLLGDSLPPAAWGAIVIVAAGLASMRTRRPAAGGLPRAGLLDDGMGWALLTAACIGTYSVIDAHGARLATSGASYVLALAPFTAVAVTVAGVTRGEAADLKAAWPSNRWKWLVGGAGTLAAYTMVMIAVRLAPVGYVTMLRESSVVLGALAGWLLLKEDLGPRRVASAGVILVGLVLLVAAG